MLPPAHMVGIVRIQSIIDVSMHLVGMFKLFIVSPFMRASLFSIVPNVRDSQIS